MLSVFAEDYDSYLRRLDLLHVVHRRCLSEGGRILPVFVLSSHEGLGSAQRNVTNHVFELRRTGTRRTRNLRSLARLRDWAE
jgi:hypothetical protein